MCLGNQRRLPDGVKKADFCHACKDIVKAIQAYSDDPGYSPFNVDRVCSSKYHTSATVTYLKFEKSCHYIIENFYDQLQDILSDVNSPKFSPKLCNEVTLACMGLTLPSDIQKVPTADEEKDYIQQQLTKYKDQLKVAGSTREL